ncbi:MAG: hypothetical protein HRT68_02530 [Flavobacteriaceae bacterium]|nr:hypothetical protein [Flavobacteriaceae bacterium]
MHTIRLTLLMSVFITFFTNAQYKQELDVLFKNESENVFHTTIKGKGKITLELRFLEEEVNVDPCYSIHHAIRSVEGRYFYKGKKNKSIKLQGGLSLDTLYLYAGIDRKLENTGVTCGKLVTYENDQEREVDFSERFMFTGSGMNQWFDNSATRVVAPIFSSEDSLVKKTIKVVLDDGRKLDLTPAIQKDHWDVLYPHSELLYKKCVVTDTSIRVLLIKHNEYSCWNDYASMIQLTFHPMSLKQIGSQRYEISRCDKLATDFDFMAGEAIEENKRYKVYSYGSEKKGGSELQLEGSYCIKEAEVVILEKWF